MGQKGSYGISVGLKKHKCHQCKKTFECRPEHRYKILKYGCTDVYDWFCSWKCIQDYRKEKEKDNQPSKRDLRILELLDQGMNLHAVAKEVGISRNGVIYVRDKWR